MRIVVDENIDAGREAFTALGDVITLPGREIDTEDVSRAEALVVRSLTRVDRTLLGGSRIRFVGTATSGYDHVDRDWLAARGIAFAHAPGCNAAAVADWVLAALATLHRERRHAFGHGTVGVIGAGQVGARVARRLVALGYVVRICDPPRAEAEGPRGFVELETALASDVVTLHVPLTDSGRYPTRDLIDGAALARIPRGAALLNAARGGIVDEDALATRLDNGPDLAVAIDTWAHEPRVDADLLARVDLGTPHVAGHTTEGRLRGTAMIARSAAAHFGIAQTWDWRTALPEPPVLEPAGLAGAASGDEAVAAILAAYDPRVDAAHMRHLLEVRPEGRRAAFDRLRRACPRRRELGSYAVGDDASALLTSAGFGQPDPADGEIGWAF